MMNTRSISREFQGNLATAESVQCRRVMLPVTAILGICLMLAIAGCQEPTAAIPQSEKVPAPQTINAGDVLKIDFPGTPTLDTTQTVRRDGRVSLSIVGEVVVTGMTPSELESDLAKRYSGQLLSSEVNVTVVSSTYSVFVTGAVLRPGKLQPDHPMTALEAVMESGGFDNTKADMENVVIVRKEGNGTVNYTLNLKDVLDGKSHELFYLKPFDIVYVKEKFQWF